MVAYGFQSRFVGAVTRGEKTHTIRKPRAGRAPHAHAGGPITLKHGPRFKPVMIGRTRCIGTSPIRLDFQSGLVCIEDPGAIAWTGEYQIEKAMALDRFARSDGFRDFADMRDFWLDTHDTSFFQGVIIRWGFPFSG